jgi:selenocysteine lyase/cysteine desulfurase
MNTQKHLFQLPGDIYYLNSAYMSPLMQQVEAAGIAGMQRKRNPTSLKPADFFSEAEQLQQIAGRLVHAKPQQIAIIPAASYGLATAINNLPLNKGDHALVVTDEFPSGYNTIKTWCDTHHKKMVVVKPPVSGTGRGRLWNEAILDSINADTTALVLSSVHWTDGTWFDLKAIGEKCRQYDVRFVVDGTQSVGAQPINVTECHIDALVCAAYKWLLGPYSIGFAYYSKAFNNGRPLEETWMNRANATDFTSLIQYNETYSPGAGRFNMGEYGNFALLPMLNAALQQILDWQPENIAAYSDTLAATLTHYLQTNGFSIEEADWRSKHLFGFGLPAHIDRNRLMQALEQEKVFVSLRGNAIRVSVHIYNTTEDIAALMGVLEQMC